MRISVITLIVGYKNNGEYTPTKKKKIFLYTWTVHTHAFHHSDTHIHLD